MFPRRQDDHADGTDGSPALTETADDTPFDSTEASSRLPNRALLAALVIVAWWPIGSYWQNDDYLAITYAQTLENGLADLIGPQYGIESLVLFLRPLITLSFVFDASFGTWAPFVSHLSNAIAHGISALCLALIVSRFAPNRCAWASGLIWGLAPCHASSVFWAVGRVDSHTTMWITLATLFLVQWRLGERRTRTLSLICFVLALGSKELAGVVPGIATVLCFAMAVRGQRVRAAIRGSWPYYAVLPAYLAWRYIAIGQVVGGYEGEVQIGPALAGLGTRTTELLNPLWRGGTDLLDLPTAVLYAGFAPAAMALFGIAVRRKAALFAVLVVLFLGCSIPSIHVWADTGNPMILRQFYLPMMPLAVLLASWGWRAAVPVLIVAVLPMLESRADYTESWQRCAKWHEQILDVVPRSAQELNFLAGLPRQNSKATTIEFDLFVDRLLLPPFSTSQHRVFALRPMSQRDTRHDLPYGAQAELPIGATFARDQDTLATVITAPTVRSLGHEWHGPKRLDLKVLGQMVQNFNDPANAKPELDPFVTLPGIRSKRYRVTVFTGRGYVTCFVQDSAQSGAKDGRVHLGSVLMSHADAHADPKQRQRVGDLLQIATALDLSTRFPVLIEADTRPEFAGRPEDFVATHANFDPIWLDLDRRFATWWP